MLFIGRESVVNFWMVLIMKNYYLYILGGQDYGPIFIESVQDLVGRIRAHKRGHLSVEAHRIDRLLYIEKFDSKQAAEARVSALQNASRTWVDALIERSNPEWLDLAAIPIGGRKIAA